MVIVKSIGCNNDYHIRQRRVHWSAWSAKTKHNTWLTHIVENYSNPPIVIGCGSLVFKISLTQCKKHKYWIQYELVVNFLWTYNIGRIWFAPPGGPILRGAARFRLIWAGGCVRSPLHPIGPAYGPGGGLAGSIGLPCFFPTTWSGRPQSANQIRPL